MLLAEIVIGIGSRGFAAGLVAVVAGYWLGGLMAGTCTNMVAGPRLGVREKGRLLGVLGRAGGEGLQW
jgi:hypothetical protein